MTHSAPNDEFSAVLVVAPIGAYMKRVYNGIRMILAHYCERKKTDVEIVLVVNSRWKQKDPKYAVDFVNPILEQYNPIAWKGEFRKYSCKPIDLDPENRDESTLWLLQKLFYFFKMGRKRKALIDLTSAPREWVYSAFDVSDFFHDVEFYFVKSREEKKPSDYEAEKTDEGKIPEIVLEGRLTAPLSRWLSPRDENGKENVQYVIFKLMYGILCEIAKKKQVKPIELREPTIDMKTIAEEARKKIPSYKETDSQDVKKGISRFLTDIDRFKLFKKPDEKITVYRKAIVIMEALF